MGKTTMKWEKEYQLLITSGLNEVCSTNAEVLEAVKDACIRFHSFDWGNVPEEDKEANNADLASRDGHVLGKYETPAGDIYINLVFDDPSIDSDYALVMFCDEY